ANAPTESASAVDLSPSALQVIPAGTTERTQSTVELTPAEREAQLNAARERAKAERQQYESLARFYIDEARGTYHTADCLFADPKTMKKEVEAVATIKGYAPHSCVLETRKSKVVAAHQ